MNKCRWISKVSDSLLYIKYNRHFLNILDVEKNVKELSEGISLDTATGGTYSIDVCPTDNNLLAAAGADKNVKIVDRRESKIVKTIDTLQGSKH